MHFSTNFDILESQFFIAVFLHFQLACTKRVRIQQSATTKSIFSKSKQLKIPQAYTNLTLQMITIRSKRNIARKPSGGGAAISF